MWKELEWPEIYTTMGRLLKAEKDFSLRLRAATSCTDAASNLQSGSKTASWEVPFSR
jgi:hypothetical protein